MVKVRGESEYYVSALFQVSGGNKALKSEIKTFLTLTIAKSKERPKVYWEYTIMYTSSNKETYLDSVSDTFSTCSSIPLACQSTKVSTCISLNGFEYVSEEGFSVEAVCPIPCPWNWFDAVMQLLDKACNELVDSSSNE